MAKPKKRKLKPLLKRETGKKLNPQQIAAIDAYFGPAKFKKVTALRMAGYAHPDGYVRMWEFPAVKAEVERRNELIRAKYDVTYESVVDEIAKIAFANLDSFMKYDEDTGDFVGFDLSKADLHEIAALGELTVETYVEGQGENAETVKRVRLKPYNKLSALEALMRHAGISKEKQPTLQVELVDRIRKARYRTNAGKSNDDDSGDGPEAGSEEGES
jgi:hypothetical protein